jgi:hypothetical protein
MGLMLLAAGVGHYLSLMRTPAHRLLRAPQHPRLNLSGCKLLRPGDRIAGAGRNRNGRFVEHDGDKPTSISGMTDGLMAIYLIGRMTERPG